MELSKASAAFVETLVNVSEASLDDVLENCTNKKAPNDVAAKAMVAIDMMVILVLMEKRSFFDIHRYFIKL